MQRDQEGQSFNCILVLRCPPIRLAGWLLKDRWIQLEGSRNVNVSATTCRSSQNVSYLYKKVRLLHVWAARRTRIVQTCANKYVTYCNVNVTWRVFSHNVRHDSDMWPRKRFCQTKVPRLSIIGNAFFLANVKGKYGRPFYPGASDLRYYYVTNRQGRGW